MSSFAPPPTIKTSWRDFTVRAVGNRVYFRPPTETFEGFLVGYLLWQLGEPWLQAERAQEQHRRHRIVEWVDAWQAVKPPPGIAPSATFKFRPTGGVRDLLGLANDVYCLAQAGGLPRSLKIRLKQRDQFQGARYEAAVAGSLARLGFAFAWHHQKSRKHCEFTARHAKGEVIAVEAKSRHRPGVLHVAEGVATGPLHADVEGLYRKALEQNPNDKPFAIFLDVNLPPDPNRSGFDKSWIRDLKAMLEKFPTPTLANPDPHAVLCVTNLGGYWEETEVANAPEVVVILSPYARFPLKDAGLFEALRRTLGRYGSAEEG